MYSFVYYCVAVEKMVVERKVCQKKMAIEKKVYCDLFVEKRLLKEKCVQKMAIKKKVYCHFFK
jgi:hypothetical protein